MSQINEHIVILSGEPQAELDRRAKAAGYDNDTSFLQLTVNAWLNTPNTNQIAEALAESLEARLTHTEK